MVRGGGGENLFLGLCTAAKTIPRRIRVRKTPTCASNYFYSPHHLSTFKEEEKMEKEVKWKENELL